MVARRQEGSIRSVLPTFVGKLSKGGHWGFLVLPISLKSREIFNRPIVPSMRKCHGIDHQTSISYLKIASNSSIVRPNPLASDDKLRRDLGTFLWGKLATLFDNRTFIYGETFVYL